MAIDVRSEVRPLKKVLLQRPGRELEISAACLIYVDFPAIFGPVIMEIRCFLSSR